MVGAASGSCAVPRLPHAGAARAQRLRGRARHRPLRATRPARSWCRARTRWRCRAPEPQGCASNARPGSRRPTGDGFPLHVADAALDSCPWSERDKGAQARGQKRQCGVGSHASSMALNTAGQQHGVEHDGACSWHRGRPRAHARFRRAPPRARRRRRQTGSPARRTSFNGVRGGTPAHEPGANSRAAMPFSAASS
jgi:hypothetical protein